MVRVKRINNSELWLVLKAQLAEYRVNSLLNIGFVISLAIATSTLLAILILNHASRVQYQEADNRLKTPVAFHIVPRQGQWVSKADFAALRRQGFGEVSPVISFRKRLHNGKWLSFRAMDLLGLSIAAPEHFDTENILLAKAYAGRLELKGAQIILADQQSLPTREVRIANWGMTALLDIELAWQLFPDIADFSYLMVTELTPDRAQRLEQSLPPHLLLQPSWSLRQRAGFADALHLNLTALALLGFVVSLFIAFQAANQAWRSRRQLAAQLRLFGVRLSTIRRGLIIEAMLLTLVASALGALFAVALVTVLLPLLGLTLNQLYQLRVSGHFDWNWQYALWSFGICLFAVMLSLFHQFKLISTGYVALGAKPTTNTLSMKSLAAVAALLLMLSIIWPQGSWIHIMVKYGLLLMMTVLLMPIALSFIIKCLLLISKSLNFGIRFILQDAANQIGRRFLTLTAFYLALTTSIAAALMVNSFETAFIKYLEQQLNEDLYIRFNQGQQTAIARWLRQHQDVTEYLLYQHAVVNIGQDRATLNTYQSPRQFGSLLLKSGTLSQRDYSVEGSNSAEGSNFAEGSTIAKGFAAKSSITAKGFCLVNEQLALKRGLGPGKSLTVTQGPNKLECEISAVYFDYGNPGFEVTIARQLVLQRSFRLSGKGFGVFFSHFEPRHKQQLISDLGLDESQLIEPGQIKVMALDIFSQTFVLTKAIAVLLLAIACAGLFMSVKTLELARRPDLIILRSLGYSKLELFYHMLGQWMLLVSCCVLLSWPVATVLADVLVAKVFPASFGWSMPLMLDLGSYLDRSLIGLICLLPALLIPLYHLNKTAP